jgi:hypothetical protein
MFTLRGVHPLGFGSVTGTWWYWYRTVYICFWPTLRTYHKFTWMKVSTFCVESLFLHTGFISVYNGRVFLHMCVTAFAHAKGVQSNVKVYNRTYVQIHTLRSIERKYTPSLCIHWNKNIHTPSLCICCAQSHCLQSAQCTVGRAQRYFLFLHASGHQALTAQECALLLMWCLLCVYMWCAYLRA